MGGWASRAVSFPDALERVFISSRPDEDRYIQRGTIPAYFDETFSTAVEQYSLWKRFGLPHGGGWIDERESLISAISIVDDGVNLHQQREMQNRRGKADDSRRAKGRHSR